MSNRHKLPGLSAEALRRWDQMADRYQTTIDRQRQVIARLLSNQATAEETLRAITGEATSLKQAREWAEDAIAKINEEVKHVDEEHGV